MGKKNVHVEKHLSQTVYFSLPFVQGGSTASFTEEKENSSKCFTLNKTAVITKIQQQRQKSQFGFIMKC